MSSLALPQLETVPAPAAATPRARSRAWMRAPSVASAVVLAFALFQTSSLRDAVTDAPSAGVELVFPPLYVVLSPVVRLADALSLLTGAQHGVVLASLLLAVVALAGVRWGAAARPRRWGRACGLAVGAILLVPASYALMVLAPRPMARLVARDPNVVRVDVHSHTNASHDGRRAFDVERNRAWHHDGGFDVAYITDHRVFTAAEAGMARNPSHGGDNTVLLSGVETWYHGIHVLVLGVGARDHVVSDDGDQLRDSWPAAARPSCVIATIPDPVLETLPVAATRDDAPRIIGLELVDAAPRGLAQGDRQLGRLVRRADSLGLRLVAGSNNHGWGRTVAAWTLVSVPGWRALSVDSLGRRIEAALLGGDASVVRVVARARPRETSTMALALTDPTLLAGILRTLSPAERIVWMAWSWAIALAAHVVAVRRGRRLAVVRGPKAS